jgi:hypothetical protein
MNIGNNKRKISHSTTPTGLQPSAQGCDGPQPSVATLGKAVTHPSTLKAVASLNLEVQRTLNPAHSLDGGVRSSFQTGHHPVPDQLTLFTSTFVFTLPLWYWDKVTLSYLCYC